MCFYSIVPRICVTVMKVKEIVIKMDLIIIHFHVLEMAKTLLLSVSG